MSVKAFGKFADVVKTKTKLIINMTERIGLEDPDNLPQPKITSALPVLAESTWPVISKMKKTMPSISNVTTTLTPFKTPYQEPGTYVMNHKGNILNVPITEILSASNNALSELKNMSSDRSLSSFSESECVYTWPGLQRHSTIQSDDSECAVTENIIDKDCLTPFMRALGNLKKGRLFENRHQIIPLEETSPSFTRLMDLLEGLSNINNRLNQKALRQVQLMWNPERRCSFHSSMKSFKRIHYTIDSKALSAHSIVQSLTSSSSETTIDKLQGDLSKNNTSTHNEKYEDSSDTKEDTTEKFETEVTKELREIYKIPNLNAKEVGCNMSEVNWKTVNLELSEIHLISIPNNRSFRKKIEEDKMPNDEKLEESDFIIIKDRYTTLLKFFYLIFYGLIYFCMAAMNFAC
ncbi:hypothetical protein WA026_011139 [Henosepilachna vigintioctopunctata]|uniref:Uncharacterized protein n=1 Tax=Henosepilachna vigintioctopunctata TaxID=420089 RepID=A0AAW1U0F1_9CUCU